MCIFKLKLELRQENYIVPNSAIKKNLYGGQTITPDGLTEYIVRQSLLSE